MPPRELASNDGTTLPQLDLLARSNASLVLANAPDSESVWDIANRICDRYLLAQGAPTVSRLC
ncbi:MAG: hypothetical protein DMG69_16075 [Acidobacteria bacterium]|nr:MAG: hypothetical protein DMG69_16075 [Acidobacteriota bacterium]